MKKIFKMLSICLIAVVFLSGCAMKSEYGIVVSKDKDVSVEILSAMDDELIDSMLGMGNSESDENKTYTDAERWEYINSNIDNDSYEEYTKEKYDKDGFKGYIYKTKLGKIDDLSTDDAEEIDLGEFDKDSKIFLKKDGKYSLNVKLSEDDSNEMESYKENVGFEVSLKVTLPNKAISNNATDVSDDGLTYTWDLLKTQDIELTFDLSGDNNTTISTTTKKNENKKDDDKQENKVITTDDNNVSTKGFEKIVSDIFGVLKKFVIGIIIFFALIIVVIVVIIVNSKNKKKNSQVNGQPNFDQYNEQQNNNQTNVQPLVEQQNDNYERFQPKYEQQNITQINEQSSLEQQNNTQINEQSSLEQQNNTQINEQPSLEQQSNIQINEQPSLEQQNNDQMNQQSNYNQMNNEQNDNLNDENQSN